MENYIDKRPKYKPHRFNRSCEFGSYDTSGVDENTGQHTREFKVALKCRYAVIRRGIGNVYALAGTELSDTISILIKHNDKINESQIVRLSDGNDYKIVSIVPDDDNFYLKYDMINVKRVDK